jgi:4-hydroxybenzoate polyprenyltransferase
MLLKTNNKLYHLVRALRPRQWIKNLVLFAPIIFQGQFFNYDYFIKTLIGFFLFSGVASAVYLINDCYDYEKDKLHPVKRNRPIASGVLSINFALIVATVLIFAIVPYSFFTVGKYFGWVLVIYLLLQLAYNFQLKQVIIIDALTISAGFILRAFAGALAIPVSISSWLILAITGTSLLLAFGKRRAERTLLESQAISKDSTREILKHYPDALLDSMISTSASFCIITYALFTFQVSPDNVAFSLLEYILPSTLVGVKFLMLTIPVVIYGVGRYLYVIYEKREGESPERVLLSDRPLLITVLIWSVLVLVTTSTGLY